jgi:two-component system sensor histidine kinase ChvG
MNSTRSKPFMASATATAKSEPAVKAAPRPRRTGWRLPGSRLGRLIIALNLLGLAVLIAGALVLNELRRGLIDAKRDSLSTQAQVIVNVLEQAATRGEPEPALDPERARDTLQLLFIPPSERARVFDAQGNLVTDSYVLGDRVEWRRLPPVRRPGQMELHWPSLGRDLRAEIQARAHADLKAEIDRALKGAPTVALRRAQNGERVVSVSVPIQNVQAVLGVLTLESGDLDQIVYAQRLALLPFILIAIAVTIASSLMLSRFVAEPVLRLARAADRVTLARAREISLPDIAGRDDELGDLTRSLEAMTRALSERMDAIERFAADVAHEIRNPLTSIRSAVETLELVSDPTPRERLTGILKHDVGRLDRLITDISNASRVDAELSREAPTRLDLGRLLADIAAFYDETDKPGAVPVRYVSPHGLDPVRVLGREGPLSQVFRNLIDNARSFSSLSEAAEPSVRLSVRKTGRQAVAMVEDDGPGLPPENLETVFERFYTARPRGALFGGHSGLGLSIARQIVEAHGGQIRAENRVQTDGRVLGARFTVTLPAADERGRG